LWRSVAELDFAVRVAAELISILDLALQHD
jgi:hypothetical protein